MLTGDVRVEEFDTEDWLAVVGLFARPFAPGEHGKRSGGVIVVCERGKVAKAIATRRGRLVPADPALLGPLADAARKHGAKWAIRLERTVIPRIVDDFARAVARDDDALVQAMKFLDVVRAFAEAGVVESHPHDFRRLLAKERIFRRLVDALCPVGKTLLFGAFENGEVRTSIALHRAERGFDRIVGPATARTEMGLVSGDYTRDARGLARAVELSVGPLALGCFAEAHVFRELFEAATPGAWASAVAARKLVFHPLAPALALPLGVDVGRAAVAFARSVAERFGVPSLFGEAGPLRPAMDRVRDFSGSPEVERRLGFDPIALLAELFGRNE
jgi:hypothetical protein